MKSDRSSARSAAEALFATTQKRPASVEATLTPQQAESLALHEKMARLKALREAREKAVAEQCDTARDKARRARAKV